MRTLIPDPLCGHPKKRPHGRDGVDPAHHEHSSLHTHQAPIAFNGNLIVNVPCVHIPCVYIHTLCIHTYLVYTYIPCVHIPCVHIHTLCTHTLCTHTLCIHVHI